MSSMNKTAARCVLCVLLWPTPAATARTTTFPQQEASENKVIVASIVGCLAGSGSDWWLDTASDPVETRFQLSSAVELRNAETSALGERKYKLLGARFFKPDSLKGRKVFVKGAVVRSALGDAVNVTSLQMVNFVCAS
jgi:hypothetical protein